MKLNNNNQKHLSRQGCATTAKKCTKTSDVRATLLFCQSKPIALCRSLVAVAVVFAEAP